MHVVVKVGLGDEGDGGAQIGACRFVPPIQNGGVTVVARRATAPEGTARIISP